MNPLQSVPNVSKRALRCSKSEQPLWFKSDQNKGNVMDPKWWSLFARQFFDLI